MDAGSRGSRGGHTGGHAEATPKGNEDSNLPQEAPNESHGKGGSAASLWKTAVGWALSVTRSLFCLPLINTPSTSHST